MRRENNSIGWEEIRLSLESENYLRKGLDLLKKYDPNNFVLEWLNNLNNNKPFLEIKPISSWLKKPMLIIGGIWDPHLKGAFELYEKSIAAGGNPEIIIGNANHLNWWEGSQKSLLDFFDKNLKNNQEIDEIKTKKDRKIWNISLNKWDYIKENPKPDYIFGLESNWVANVDIVDGSLLINSRGSGGFVIVHDPWRPAQSGGGHLGPNPGEFDRDLIDKRLDVGVFQTNSLEENIFFSGIPILETSIISDQPSFDICLALSVVNDNKKTVNQFSTGFLRVRKSKIDKASNYEITMHPTNLCILKGNKIRLSISAAAYPAIGVNNGTGDEMLGSPSVHHRIITLSFILSNTSMKMTPFFR